MSELLEQIGPIDVDAIQSPQPVDSELRGAVYLADSTLSDGESPVAVLFSQWSDYCERAKQQGRTEVLADHIKGLAITVDNPGVSPQADPMSSEIKQALKEGDLSKVSILQWDAVGTVLDQKGYDFGDVKRLVGYSLGSHLAASAAKHAPGEVSLSQLDLFETPVISKKASQAKTMATLAMRFLAHSGDKLTETIAANPDWAARCRNEDPLLLPKMVLQRPTGLWQYPRAITHPENDIASDLMGAGRRSLREAVVTVSATNADKVSPIRDNERLVQQLGAAGMSVVGFKIMHSVHASQDNMAWWKGVLEEVDARVKNQ